MTTDQHDQQSDAPLLVEPRLDAKPWGGHRLERFGLSLPPDAKIGEALVTAGDAVVSSGGTLGDLVRQNPDARLGPRGREAVSGRDIFPLLVKLIDAEENLSIQVHPDDAEAKPLDRLGKTEAWYVLASRPGGALYLGLRPEVSIEQFREACGKLDGSSAPLLRRVEAEPGTAVLIPAGTVHALGAGVMVYEIQQPSDVTFRLDDWGRVDAQGRPREMHLAQGFAVAKPDSRPELIAPVPLASPTGRRDLLAACRYFALERITLDAGEAVPLRSAASPQVVTALEGTAHVTNAGGEVDLTAGRSCALWPSDAAATLTATERLVALRAWVPDIASDIVTPALAAGASQEAIEALDGPLDDIQTSAGVRVSVTLADRYAGCLVGLACGDALGGPVEFQSREAIAARFPGGVREMVGGGWLDLTPGEVTDDTQMMLAIARACTPDGIDIDRVATNFVAWYRSKPKDIGTTTRAALAAIAGGAPWREAGEAVYRANPAGAANGALMRCAPVALRFRTDPERLVRASLDTARVTHAAPRASWATVALNQAIVHLLNGGDRAGVLAAARSGIDEPQTVAALDGIPARTYETLESGGYVLATLTAALWCLRNCDSAEEAIVAAVSLGDDADTTGAVTGALAGACWGINALPNRWCNVLQHHDELIDLAGRLLEWCDKPQ